MSEMTTKTAFSFRGAAAALALTLGLAACASSEPAGGPAPETSDGGWFGSVFGSGDAEVATPATAPTYAALDDEATGLGVNALLWRSALDTLSFMPLASADPFGGVIISDWYQPPESPGERFKLTVYILDKRLRADGLQVNVFRQERDAMGSWQDALISGETRVEIENAILTRARQLRLNSVEN